MSTIEYVKNLVAIIRAIAREMIELKKWDSMKDPPGVDLMVSDTQRRRLDDHVRAAAQLSGRSEDAEWDRMVNFTLKGWEEKK